MERTQKTDLVGRHATKMDRHRSTGFSGRKVARFSPNRKRERPRWNSRQCAVHIARRRSRLAARCEGFAGRANANTLRTARVARAQCALLTRHEPGGQLVYT